VGNPPTDLGHDVLHQFFHLMRKQPKIKYRTGFVSCAPAIVHSETLEAFAMKQVHEVLRMKENRIAQVRKEVEALRLVAPLLSESDQAEGAQSEEDSDDALVSLEDAQLEASGDSEDVVLQSIGPKRSRLRDWLGRAAGE
jgi:hypothetical protein